MTEVATTEKKV